MCCLSCLEEFVEKELVRANKTQEIGGIYKRIRKLVCRIRAYGPSSTTYNSTLQLIHEPLKWGEIMTSIAAPHLGGLVAEHEALGDRLHF